MVNLPQDPLLVHAHYQWKTYRLPSHLYQQYRAHYHNAKSRGIAFRFTFGAWVSWWRVELAKKGENKHRGNQRGSYMMCRIGDTGGYEPGNVYCGSTHDNSNDRDKVKTAAWSQQWHATHHAQFLGKRGDSHPKSRAVMDHLDIRYGSITLAAEAHAITRQAGFYRVQTGKWRYADSARTGS